jgi:hypothetical protein
MQSLSPSRSLSLAHFQDAFSQALLGSDAAPAREVAALTAQPAFAVYRNTVMKGCIDALLANYPAVTRLVGEEWMRAAAAIHVQRALPADPTLLRYGSDFEEFLAHFTPAAELPYLPGVARLDRLWNEAHAARDEAAMRPSAIAQLTPDVLACTVLHPHAAARWAWFGDAPIYTLWSRNRTEDPSACDVEWQAEGALLTRPDDAVTWIAADAATCAFLDTCAAGGTLTAAAQAALDMNEKADLAQLMSLLLTAGAFGRMSIAHE